MDKAVIFAFVSIPCLFKFSLVSSQIINDTCGKEITYGFKTNFTWNVPTTTGFFISTPNCFDENAQLIERYCSNSTWTPKRVTCHEKIERKESRRRPNNSSAAQVDTILTFDQKRRKMQLMVYSPEMVKQISCYTFILEEKKVSIDKIFDSKSKSSSSQKHYVVFELDIGKYPMEYWCKISQINNSTNVNTQKVVGYRDDDLHQEFVMRATLNRDVSFDDVEDLCDKMRAHCRLMKILKATNRGRDVLIHITLYFENNKVINGYNKLFWRFKNFINFKYILSSDYCLPGKTGIDKVLYWKLTPLGEKAKPSELCLDKNGILVTRKCIGNFLEGAYFEDFNQKCAQDITVSKNTMILYDIWSKHNFTVDVFKNFSSVIKHPLNNVSINDVSLFSDGLFEIDYNEEIEDDYFDSVDTLNTLDHEVLITSQVSLNATDKVLDALENFLEKKAETYLNESVPTALIQKKNFIAFATKPSFSNISGIAVYGNESKSFTDYTVVELSDQDTLQNISRENLELAVHIPTILLDQNGNSSLIVTVYYNDSLFNEENLTNVADSRVIGVTMPGLGRYLESPIPLLLRPLETMNENFAGCGYWQYGQASPSRKGQWSTKGGEDVDVDDMIYCTYSHLTHFGLLILSERISQNEGVPVVVDSFSYNSSLNIVTIVGCSFSLVGILGIFITAIMFKRFREKIGSKILMLLSIPISLEIILTQLAGLDNWNSNPTICTTVGILLHYVVLLKFSWMFIIALLQYVRFVRVLGPMPQRIFLKANLACWLIPAIPVALTATIFPESYTAGAQKFCYPKQMALYLGLFTPAFLIILFNILIFVVIMISISNSKAVKYDKSGTMLRRQTYLAILLFFMLGIPWLFGILAEIFQSSWLEITFVFLFCLTATLQGFVLFAFYVVLDKDTRNLWVTYAKQHRRN